jgi:quinol monooxygenase YgiN
MPLHVFVRFHARAGKEEAVAGALRGVLAPSRAEAGCLTIGAFRSTRDPLLFYIHSRWIDEAAFDLHASFPHTVRFLEQVEPLLDHRLEAVRTYPLE